MYAKIEFSLLVFLAFSLFLVSQCYHHQTPALIELQRCQMKCLVDEDHGTRHQTLCLMKCHEGYANAEELIDSYGSTNPQIEDPQKQFERCQRGCERYQGERQREPKQLCQEKCKEQFEELKRQQAEREQRGQGGGGTVGEQDDVRPGPEKMYKQCLALCNRRTEGEQWERCKQECLEEYSKKRGQGINQQGSRGEQGPGEQENNPYFFEGKRFKSRLRTEAGDFKVLQRFSKRSDLLNGIDNYRLAIYEADPNTFLVPHHCDADIVVFVARGEGTIGFVHHRRRESFNLERGDAIRVPAGATVYLINRHNNEKLRVFMLLRPINTPGRFKGYFGAGGQEKEAFYRVFSNEILEAAFNTPRDKLERLFGQKREGVIVRANQEQIRALSQHAKEGSSKHHGGKSRGPFNLLNQKPSFCNNYGQLFLASPDEFKQLEDLDVSVAVMNIKQGAMVAPYYNSRSSILVLVAEGGGYFEMACPHLASQSQPGGEQEQRGTHYVKVGAQVSVGDAFIIPAGHPISIVSTGNQNLQLVGFGINAQNNHKNFLAGQDNIWNNVESEAKELSFGVPSREIDEVFRSQEHSYFVPGPGQQEQQRGEAGTGRGIPLPAILDFVGFM